MVRGCFPNVPSSYGKHCFQCHFLLSTCKLCLRYTAGNFNENPSMRALAKILRARASEHLSNFCEQFKQRPNFASTFKLDGTIRYPYFFFLQLLWQFRETQPEGRHFACQERRTNVSASLLDIWRYFF